MASSTHAGLRQQPSAAVLRDIFCDRWLANAATPATSPSAAAAVSPRAADAEIVTAQFSETSVNRPAVPQSPVAGQKRLSGRGDDGSVVIWPSQALLAIIRSMRPGAAMVPNIACTVGSPTQSSRGASRAALKIASAATAGSWIGGTG